MTVENLPLRRRRGIFNQRVYVNRDDVAEMPGFIRRSGVAKKIYAWMKEDRDAAGLRGVSWPGKRLRLIARALHHQR